MKLNIEEAFRIASGKQDGKTRRTIEGYLSYLKKGGTPALPLDQLHWLIDQFDAEAAEFCRGGFAFRVMRQLESWASKSDERLLAHFRRILESAGDVDPIFDAKEQVPWAIFTMSHCAMQGAQGVPPYSSDLWERLHALTPNSKEARMILAAFQFLTAAMNFPPAVAVENREELVGRMDDGEAGWISRVSPATRQALGYTYGYQPEDQFRLHFDDENEQEAALEFAKLIAGKRDVLVYGLLQMWEEIRTEPNYDVRPGASDSFFVSGVLGKLTGCQRIFMRERTKFPVVSVISDHSWSFGKIRLSGALDLSNLYQIDEGLDNCKLETAHGTILLLRLANNFINGFAYHCIVRKEKAEAVGRQRVVGAESTHTSRAESCCHWVRPHFRKLREGDNPSKDKQQEALERFGHLPPGMTFVSEHERQSASAPRTEQGFPRPFLRLDPETLIAAL